MRCIVSTEDDIEPPQRMFPLMNNRFSTIVFKFPTCDLHTILFNLAVDVVAESEFTSSFGTGILTAD